MKVLNFILSESYSISTKYSFTLTRLITRYSGTFSFNSLDQTLLISRMAEINEISFEKAADLYNAQREKTFLRKAGRLRASRASLGFIPIIVLFALIFLSSSDSVLLHACLLLLSFLLLALVCGLCGSRKRRMRKVWQCRQATSEGIFQTVQKLAEIQNQPFLKVANKPLLALTAACVIAIAGIAIPPFLSDSLPEQIVNLQIYSEKRLNKALELLKPLSEKKAAKVLNQAYAKEDNAAFHVVMYAELANRLADAGVISREIADEWDARSMNEQAIAVVNGETAWLLALFERVDESDVDALIDRFIAAETRSERRVTALGQYCGSHKTTAEVLEISAAAGNGSFIQVAFTGDSLARFEQRLAELSDHQQRVLLAQNMAPMCTVPDLVLSILRTAGEYGLKPTDCYPTGAVLNWDLTQLDHYSALEATRSYSKWLPVLINEKPEPLEKFDVPEELESSEKDFLSSIPEDYEGNDALGKDAFVVVLDTAMLEAMPAEFVPQTLEELDALLAMNNLYVRSGTLRDTRNTSTGAIWYQQDYPAYAALQTVDIYDMQSMKLVHRFSSNVILPDEKYALNVSSAYLKKPDQEWMEQERIRVMELLKSDSWDLETAVFHDTAAALFENENP